MSRHALLGQIDEQRRQRIYAKAKRAIEHNGYIAGEVLRIRLRDLASGGTGAIGRALPIVHAALLHDADLPWKGLPPAAKLVGQERVAALAALGSRRVHRQRLLQTIDNFMPVAHLWAALFILRESNRDEGFLAADRLPLFINLSMAVRAEACRRRLMSKHDLWERGLPSELKLAIDIKPLVLSRFEKELQSNSRQ